MNLAKTERSKIFTLFCAVIIVWGVNWPIMKFGLHYITPFWFAVFRVLSGAVCLFLLLAAKRQLHIPSRKDLPVILTVGTLQIGAGMTFMHIALTRVDAGQSAILAYTTPIWAAPLAAVFLREQMEKGVLLGLFCGVCGIVALLNPFTFRLVGDLTLAANFLLILAALFWAITIIHVRIHKWQGTPLQLMPFQMLIGGLMIIPFAVIFDGYPQAHWSPTLIAVLLYNGPLASAFCFWGYVSVARNLRATTTAIGSLGIPVVGLLSSALLLRESLAVNKVLGLVFICSGILFVTTAERLKGQPLWRFPAVWWRMMRHRDRTT